MADWAAAVGWVFVAIALIGAIYTFAAGGAVGWFLSRREKPGDQFPPVTILKPLHGGEAGLRTHLEEFCTQDYPAPVQIIFGVREASDPAVAVVRSLQKAWPQLDIELVIDDRIYGTNLKISNLMNMERKIAHPVIVLADSDISVSPNYLKRVVSALQPDGMGFVTCAYVGRPMGNTWSRLSAMSINYHFLPSVALGLVLKLARPCFGPTIAFTRKTFDEFGGFTPFANLLADDYEIGRAILEKKGVNFCVPPIMIVHACPEVSGRSVFVHELRWARTIRIIDPLGFAGSVITHPLPFALVGAVLQPGSVVSLTALLLVVISRLYVMYQVDSKAGMKPASWWLFVPRDLMSAAVYFGAYIVKSISWRGHQFRVDGDGVLVQR
ncbi:MAG: bacteriohopanetetrol glucosamine biosynthesis glycosyltransferase HpnI [Caulobacteraceae bacterium]